RRAQAMQTQAVVDARERLLVGAIDEQVGTAAVDQLGPQLGSLAVEAGALELDRAVDRHLSQLEPRGRLAVMAGARQVDAEQAHGLQIGAAGLDLDAQPLERAAVRGLGLAEVGPASL